jgi:hypothetical protein
MDTPTLKELLKQEMEKYAGEGANSVAYLTISPDEQTYAIVDIATFQGKRRGGTFMIARIIDNRIEIELDNTDKTLDEALVAVGVPQEQIVVRYREETVA